MSSSSSSSSSCGGGDDGASESQRFADPSDVKSLQQSTDELLSLSSHLKAKAGAISGRERALHAREVAVGRREQEQAGREQYGTSQAAASGEYVAELEAALQSLREQAGRLKENRARARTEQADAERRLGATMSCLQESEAKGAALAEQCKALRGGGAEAPAAAAAVMPAPKEPLRRHHAGSTGADVRRAAAFGFVGVLFELMAEPRRGQLLLPRKVSSEKYTAQNLPDYSALAAQAFACAPELMAAAAALGEAGASHQHRVVEFLWCCVRNSLQTGAPLVSRHPRRRLMDLLSESMEDGSAEVWCSSASEPICCLSLLLVLHLGLAPADEGRKTGVRDSDARLVARGLEITAALLETREGKRLFLLYRGVPTLSLLLRSGNRVIRRPASLLALLLSSEGPHLQHALAALGSQDFFRSSAIVFALCGTANAPDVDVQDNLAVVLQRLSAKQSCKPLFNVGNLHSSLLDALHGCPDDRDFFKANLSSILAHLSR